MAITDPELSSMVGENFKIYMPEMAKPNLKLRWQFRVATHSSSQKWLFWHGIPTVNILQQTIIVWDTVLIKKESMWIGKHFTTTQDKCWSQRNNIFRH